MPASEPTGTYRLQLRSQFGFGDAQQVLDYLDALGIKIGRASCRERVLLGV